MPQYPKDADGISAPLDTAAMHRKNGNQFHVPDFAYEAGADKRHARTSVDFAAVDGPYPEIEVETDASGSREKLETGLKRAADCRNPRMFGYPIRAYAGVQDSGFRDCCRPIEDEYRAIAACAI